MNLNSLIRLTSYILPKPRMFAQALAAVALLQGVLLEASYAQISLLRTNGRNLVNADGKIVSLRGVNLGGWFIMENGWHR